MKHPLICCKESQCTSARQGAAAQVSVSIVGSPSIGPRSCSNSLLFTPIRQPALNKWTSVDPAIRRRSLHVLFHGITRRATQRALKLPETSDIEDFVAEAVAPAIQTPTVHRRLQTSRDQVAARFSNMVQKAAGECFPGWRFDFP